MKKKILYTFLTLFNMGLIFYFSSQNGDQSNITSGWFQNFLPFSMFMIRKMAHFTIYALLGFNSYQMLKSYRCKHCFIYSLCICVLYAVSDEFHQSFIDERSPQVRDVCIDSCGALFSSSLLKLKDRFR